MYVQKGLEYPEDDEGNGDFDLRIILVTAG